MRLNNLGNYNIMSGVSNDSMYSVGKPGPRSLSSESAYSVGRQGPRSLSSDSAYSVGRPGPRSLSSSISSTRSKSINSRKSHKKGKTPILKRVQKKVRKTISKLKKSLKNRKK